MDHQCVWKSQNCKTNSKNSRNVPKKTKISNRRKLKILKNTTCDFLVKLKTVRESYWALQTEESESENLRLEFQIVQFFRYENL